jgi:hypothetical protein
MAYYSEAEQTMSFNPKSITISSSMQTEDIPEIKAVPTTIEDKSWIEHYRSESQGTLKRLEETAKYLSGLSSISLTIILGPNHDIFKVLQNSLLLKAGIISWLLSIIFSLVVVFPFRYRYVTNSITSIKKTQEKKARLKFRFLILASVLFLTGISLIACLYLFVQAPV